MSDYMFMLESRLSGDQNRALALIQAAAAEANLNLFLAGGAVRDLLGHFPIRDLDFTIEGNGLKFGKELARKFKLEVTAEDDLRKSVELCFPGRVSVEIAMSRTEKYPKAGGKPQVSPAPIHEDLRRRDFTINAIALSLNKASRGLLLDPVNGSSDLERRELRACANHSLYDDPSRIARLYRLAGRLGFTVDERTANQAENARQADLLQAIPAAARRRELLAIARDPQFGEILKKLDEQNLAVLFAPDLAGPKLNPAGLQKLEKAIALVPFGIGFETDDLAIFLSVLTEKFTAKEMKLLVETSGLTAAEVEAWHKLESRARKLESQLKSDKLKKPSQVWTALAGAPGEQVLFLLLHSAQRLVQDRIKNYLQKYAPAAAEITPAEIASEVGVAPDSPKFAKLKAEFIAKRLDARPKRVPVEEPPPPPPPPPANSPRISPRAPRVAAKRAP
jgi:tRNA nucleotidyltransferase/poly(A) polymerase